MRKDERSISTVHLTVLDINEILVMEEGLGQLLLFAFLGISYKLIRWWTGNGRINCTFRDI